jgi:Mycobacterium 19 kDa lipoprotein antigen
MKHRFLLAAVGSITVIAGSTACPTTGGWVSSADPNAVHLTVDGQPQAVQGALTCPTANSQTLSVGSQIDIAFTPDGSQVGNVGINTPGEHLQYFKGGYGPGDASVTRAGNTYKITGNITGSSLNGALKPFELDVTCP